jgi:pimeloyl-ACP methyl ester carboxylesterase
MDDLDEVRQALGYGPINLYGGSYGTRAALVYMRRHPEAVRAAVLDGAAPPSIKLPLYMARDAQEALRRAFEDCDADAECRAAFPDLGESFATLLDTLARASARVDTRHPRTGERVDVEITRDLFVSGLRGALYDPHLASLIPLILRRAIEGDFDPFVTLGLALSEGINETISLGMFLSVVCSEDIPQITAADREAALPGTFLGGVMLDAIAEACEVWPRGVLPAGYHEPVSSERPVLILSGALDPATPPRWGEAIARHLPQARHVLAPGVGHNVLPHGCVPDVVARFVETGTAEELDASCIARLRRPPFFLGPAGPAP